MRTILLVFLLLTAKMGYAQPYYFKHYQVENGLSNNSVFSNVQDRDGLMWFGTKDGLNRFDGYSFKTYRHDPADPESLGNDKVHALVSDPSGGLWLGTDQGVYKYHPQKETFSPIKESLKMGISVLQVDHEGTLWILSGEKVYTYQPLKKLFQEVKMEDSFSATHLYCRPNGQMLISSPQADLALYNKNSRAFETKYRLTKEGSSSFGRICAMAESPDQQLIIGTSNEGLKLFNLKTKVLKDLIIQNKDKTHIYVRDIQALNDHEFWIGTESGLYSYHLESGKITHLQKQLGNPYSLSDNAIYTLCKDKEGGIWMGTYFGGINYYSPKSSVFSKYFPQPEQNSISGNDIREITKDKNGNFWIGTEDAGLNKLDPKTGRFTSFFPDGSKSSIAHSNIHGLLADGNKLWISTFEHGIDLMDIQSGRIIKHYQAGVGNALRSNFSLHLYKTKSGDVLVATTVGLYKYERKKDDFEAIPGLPLLFFNNILEDSKGRIWAGTYSEGLFCFKPGVKGYQNFRHEAKNRASLASNTVNGIFEDSRKNLWVATDGGGLSLLNSSQTAFKSYTVKDGFPSNFIFRMQEDQQQNLWISSTRGLIRFNPILNTLKVYTRADGLLTDQFNYNSSFKDLDGRMFFGSVKGMVSFQPSQLSTTKATAPVFLTDFKIDNKGLQDQKEDSILNESILFTKEITLQHDQSSFSIDFAALSFISPEMTEYAYKMTGLYNDWEYLKTNRKVYFTKLAPGTYVFEAKAMISGSKEWSHDNVKLIVTVLPPFWKTNFAYILYGLLFIGFLAILIWQYHQRTERKSKRLMELFEHEKEKEIYQAKIEFFTNVAHEIRTPLTLIKGPMEKLIKQAKEVPLMEKNLNTMNRNTDRLLDLTNQLLDFRKTEVSGFSLNFVSANISQLLEDVALQFQFAAEHKNMVYETELPREAVHAYVDLEALYKILSNLIDNAIKYGLSEIKVLLTVNEAQDEFSIEIKSDGQKIAPELNEKIFEPFYRAKESEMKQGTGIGLSISQALAELHNGKLYLQVSEGAYNIFVVKLPIQQSMGFNLKGKWKKITLDQH
ncbi:two-component regulator propeller domain-containing protein [Pedobacter gandavensis]|uniref:ligand-binding sensor domain-containing protein n=1 Tax=Pedobacter gandavensis TaxID=2679963 RepID=UPI00292FCD13|nr:two-component regulator propeller domain-containing protein [Pedobacter gandavensis]